MAPPQGRVRQEDFVRNLTSRGGKQLLALVVAAVSVAAFASIAVAAVTYYPNGDDPTSTGLVGSNTYHPYGYVGKGDVQSPAGLNNAQMQAVATGVTFTYSSSEEYEGVCTWTTGEGTRGERVHNVSRKRSTTVNAAVSADARKTGQWTGWNLTGLGSTTTTGSVPEVGGDCNGSQGHDGVWTSVTQLSSSGGSLTAHVPAPYAQDIALTPSN